ncbi:MAG: hypothetical protein M3321_06795 [Actinomycetota bacterium]|nr:hypothetical protein [Actinomycetota bacterium]
MLKTSLAALVGVLAAAVVATPLAVAHNLDQCGTGATSNWSSTSTHHTWPSTWMSEWQTALQNATSEFNVSSFTYYSGSTV